MRVAGIVIVMSVLLSAGVMRGEEISVVIDSMGGPYAGGPIGQLDEDWTFFGYGPPSFNYEEAGLHADDDASQGWGFPPGLQPGSFPAEAATVAYVRWSFDPHAELAALGAPPIDRGQPITFSAWFYGFHGLVDPIDPVFSPYIECFIRAETDYANRVDTSLYMAPLEGETWKEATSTLLNGVDSRTSFALAVGFNFDTWYYDPQYQTTVLVDNITVTYTPAVVQTVRILSIQHVAPDRILLQWEPSLGRTYQVMRQSHAVPGYLPTRPFVLLGPVLNDQESLEDTAPPPAGAYYKVRIID